MDMELLKCGFENILKNLELNFKKLCIARLNPDLVSNIPISCYGGISKLNEVANISIPQPRTILIKPYDASIIEEIHKSLIKHKSEYAPVIDGDTLKIMINPPTHAAPKAVGEIPNATIGTGLPKHEEEAEEVVVLE